MFIDKNIKLWRYTRLTNTSPYINFYSHQKVTTCDKNYYLTAISWRWSNLKINSLIISIIHHAFIHRARKIIIDEIQKKKVEKNLIKKYGKDTHWIRDKRDESMNKLKSHWWWWICICRWLIACIRQLRHEWGKVVF